MKTLIGIVVVLAIIVVFIFFSKNVFHSGFNSNVQAKTTINNHSINLLIAKDEKQKEQGLSGMNSLPEDEAMVFPFDTAGYYAFWMKDMKFPIDMVFLHNKQIVTIFQNVPNPKTQTDALPIYKPYQPADMVVELPAGESKKLGIKEGDLINISL